MDGAVVLSSDGTRIVRAAVHLMPDSAIPTDESGTRHRTAERVARQTGTRVISVSQSMHIIGLYVNGTRHVIDDSTAILSHGQPGAGDARSATGSSLDRGRRHAVGARDRGPGRPAATPIAVVQRLEMVRRIADEIEGT